MIYKRDYVSTTYSVIDEIFFNEERNEIEPIFGADWEIVSHNYSSPKDTERVHVIGRSC